MHIHILGICGTFMGGVAQLARQLGHRVTGCDANVYPPMSTQLEQAGIELIEGFSADQVAMKPDLFVIGNVVSRGNPLMEKILDMGLPYVSGPQWVGDHILAGRHTLAVAGTHGKTTTTSMLAWVLESAGLKPGFLVGGVPADFGCSARLGEGEPFVIEADEYDTAFFDKRSKFVHYRPRTAILNNLEFDHADIFPDLAAIQTQFHHLVRTIPASGCVVVNAAETALAQVLEKGCWSGVLPFNTEAGFYAADIDSNRFDVLLNGEVVGQVNWTLTGEHNRSNALACIAAAMSAGVTPEQACEALSEFKGVARRMELRGRVADIAVYDDFAHHPTAITTTVAGLRRSMGAQGRILAVFEPRSNTMKLGVMRAALPASLVQADAVFCYTQGLGWDAADTLKTLTQPCVCSDDLSLLVKSVVQWAQPGDAVLVMSNGGFGGIHPKILSGLQARFEA
ncbi:MAG: UDP-N-acetylmuramate:L-alanyl-gamma-D-glutamyl-meso-diaminopimelate ligase [Burkholderiales bacterium]|jgi:UDP-N-acetylmuramate: L-alanyl-gamma-D-glutamyl-meso-diaminopimelate ligase|nr:UDP-N-acetylmuramate:L-alanyl-gamma-D-glutamyl-meso-diaminopimelate ligase [Burkholderiales bacterium]